MRFIRTCNDNICDYLGCLLCTSIITACLPPLRSDPGTSEEQELIENLFDATCSCLMLPENKTVFVQGEGERKRFRCRNSFPWVALWWPD